jgi:hypothetical protein
VRVAGLHGLAAGTLLVEQPVRTLYDDRRRVRL